MKGLVFLLCWCRCKAREVISSSTTDVSTITTRCLFIFAEGNHKIGPHRYYYTMEILRNKLDLRLEFSNSIFPRSMQSYFLKAARNPKAALDPGPTAGRFLLTSYPFFRIFDPSQIMLLSREEGDRYEEVSLFICHDIADCAGNLCGSGKRS